jgi:protein-tyrosine phosphatase
MRYAVIFMLLCAGLIYVAFRVGGWGWLVAWPASSALLVAAGYGGWGARVFGKRRDGAFAAWAWVVHLPYLLITSIVWHLMRLFSRENVADEVAPGVWVGRRPLLRELPKNVVRVVDLTAEFWPAAGIRKRFAYVCYPTLDAHVCADEAFAEAVRETIPVAGPIYIHCAQGHGRSAALAAALLIAHGAARDVEEAEKKLCAARPGVCMERVQRDLVARTFAGIRTLAQPSPNALSRSASVINRA